MGTACSDLLQLGFDFVVGLADAGFDLQERATTNMSMSVRLQRRAKSERLANTEADCEQTYSAE